MESGGIFELAVVISLAAALGLVARLLRQPMFLAYLITGIIIGVFKFNHLVQPEFFHVFSELGIMFLLFLVGLEVNYSSIRSVGKIAIILGIGQIVFTFALGYLIMAYGFGYGSVVSAYVSLALTFSSTVIIVKLLSDKKDLNSLYGKITVGFMLVQDFVAIFVLIILAGMSTGVAVSLENILAMLIKGISLFAAAIIFGRYLLPYVFDRAARSKELLFLLSLAWLFAVVAIVQRMGFSIEIAGFIAGFALANSSENFEISSHVRPIKDFFLLIFFIILGSSVIFSGIGQIILPIILLSLFVLIGNPLIVMSIMGLLGYRHRTSFLAGLTVAQISEFSIILAAFGLRLGHLGQSHVALVTGVGVVTITTSTYMIMNGDYLARRLRPILHVFEKKDPYAEDGWRTQDISRPIVLIGAKRTGQSIAYHIPKKDLLVIDFDPDVVQKLKALGYTCILGDIGDSEILDAINIEQSHLIISTSPDFADNMTLIRTLKKIPGKRKVVVRARTEIDARLLYKKGADYVIMPHFTAGHYMGKAVADDPTGSFIKDLRTRDMSMLKHELITS